MNMKGFAIRSAPPLKVDLARLLKSVRLVTKMIGVFLFVGKARIVPLLISATALAGGLKLSPSKRGG